VFKLRRMKDNRMGGIALIAGTIGGVVTLAIHPSGHDLFVPEQFTHTAYMLVVAHALAIASMVVVFLGALVLTRCLASDRCGIAALVVYGFASMAVMSAAVIDGFIGPGVLRKAIFTAPPVSEQWRVLLAYNELLNQGFAQVFVVGSAVAIVLWSASIVRSRLLALAAGIYGLLLGMGSVIAIVAGISGQANAMHLVMLGQLIWFLVVGTLMWQLKLERLSGAEAGS
jgi:hypothetical protein